MRSEIGELAIVVLERFVSHLHRELQGYFARRCLADVADEILDDFAAPRSELPRFGLGEQDATAALALVVAHVGDLGTVSCKDRVPALVDAVPVELPLGYVDVLEHRLVGRVPAGAQARVQRSNVRFQPAAPDEQRRAIRQQRGIGLRGRMIERGSGSRGHRLVVHGSCSSFTTKSVAFPPRVVARLPQGADGPRGDAAARSVRWGWRDGPHYPSDVARADRDRDSARCGGMRSGHGEHLRLVDGQCVLLPSLNRLHRDRDDVWQR